LTVIDSYEAFISELPSGPIIMGHSLGGAIKKFVTAFVPATPWQ
jgi:hypothetical protein